MFLISFSCLLLDGLEHFSVQVNTVEYKHDDEHICLVPDLSRKMFNISQYSISYRCLFKKILLVC